MRALAGEHTAVLQSSRHTCTHTHTQTHTNGPCMSIAILIQLSVICNSANTMVDSLPRSTNPAGPALAAAADESNWKEVLAKKQPRFVMICDSSGKEITRFDCYRGGGHCSLCHDIAYFHFRNKRNIFVEPHEFDLYFPSGEKFGPGDCFTETCDDVIFILKWKQGADRMIPWKPRSPSNDR